MTTGLTGVPPAFDFTGEVLGLMDTFGVTGVETPSVPPPAFDFTEGVLGLKDTLGVTGVETPGVAGVPQHGQNLYLSSSFALQFEHKCSFGIFVPHSGQNLKVDVAG